jgi:hypothetical protein
VLGFALAGGGTNWNLAQGLGGGRSDAFQAGVYGATRWGPAYLAASFAYAEHWISTDRVGFAFDSLTAKFDAESYGGRVGGQRFSPLARINKNNVKNLRLAYAVPLVGAVVHQPVLRLAIGIDEPGRRHFGGERRHRRNQHGDGEQRSQWPQADAAAVSLAT